MTLDTPGLSVLAAFGLVLLAGCGRSPRVEVEDAAITLPALAGQPGAAYFRLETRAGPERLLRIETPAAQRVEFHETRMQGGVASMAALPDPAFDPDGRLTFTPGGRHAMLFGMAAELAPGARTTITFVFQKAPPVTVEAEIRGPGMGHSAD